MIMGIDYAIRGDLGGDTLPVEVLSGPWKGVILTFKTVVIREETEGAKIQWDLEIIESGKFKTDLLKKDQKFKDHTGFILNAMILSMVDDGEPLTITEYNDI